MQTFVTLADGRRVRLGRIRPRFRPKVLRFGAYFNPIDATQPPTAVDYSARAMAALQQIYLNDTEGDCVIAGKYHAAGVWTGNETGVPAVGTDAEVQNAYVTICGPGDQGCVITDVLNYFETTGLTLGGVVHKIDGYVAVDWTNPLEVQVALYLFGALTIGINLPEAWTTAEVWDVTGTPIVGGHDVTIVGYNATGVTVSSWGQLFTMTWAALESTTWVEEMYAMLASDWYGSALLAPCGVDAVTLKADLAKLGGGTIPPLDPAPTPTPTPTPVPVPSPTPTLIPTTLTLTSSAKPGVAGQPITFTAVVTPQVGAGLPTGQVVFNVDDGPTTTDEPLSVVNGASVAVLTLPSLTAGMHGVAAKYLGDPNFAVSLPVGIPQPVNPAPSPTPTPTVAGLTLAEAIAAMVAGIEAGRPYGPANVAAHAEIAGAKGLTAAWPTEARPVR